MDPDFAKQQYLRYRKHFFIQRLGFRMFREHPEGLDRAADVDSGPIIWGAGTAATRIGLGAAIANGDMEMAQDIHDLANLFGWPTHLWVDGQEGQQYMLGFFPIGDAFLTWGYSLPEPVQPISKVSPFGTRIKSRFRIYLIWLSCTVLILIRGFFLLRSFRRNWNQKKKETSRM